MSKNLNWLPLLEMTKLELMLAERHCYKGRCSSLILVELIEKIRKDGGQYVKQKERYINRAYELPLHEMCVCIGICAKDPAKRLVYKAVDKVAEQFECSREIAYKRIEDIDRITKA